MRIPLLLAAYPNTLTEGPKVPLHKGKFRADFEGVRKTEFDLLIGSELHYISHRCEVVLAEDCLVQLIPKEKGNEQSISIFLEEIK